MAEQNGLGGHVLLVDAAYADTVAGRLAMGYARAGDRAPLTADLADWLVCCALDGGARPGEGGVSVTLVCALGQEELRHFRPSLLAGGVDGQAFLDPALGEFALGCAREEDTLPGGGPLVAECAELALARGGWDRLTVVADTARYGARLRGALRESASAPRVTLLTMEPQGGATWREAQLGMSLTHALGLAPDEAARRAEEAAGAERQT